MRTSLSWSAAFLFVLAVFLPRGTSLGRILTVDELLWQGRAHQLMTGVATFRPQLTFASGQPGVTTMWVAGLADRFDSLAASQAAIAVTTGMLISVATALLIRLLGRVQGLLAGFFLALDPFLIAHSRVVHTDALLAVSMLLTLLFLALAWKTRMSRYLVFAGIGTAWAMLSKVFGGFVLLPGLFTTIVGPVSAPWHRRFFAYGGAFIATMLILWPALWSPHVPLRFMTDRAAFHAQEADVGKGGDDPWYYAREWLFRLHPVTTIAGALGLVGAIAGGIGQLPRMRGRRFFLAIAASACAYGLVLSAGGQKSDRYFIFGTTAMDMLAAGGIVWGVDFLTRFFPHMPRRAAIAIFGLASVGIMGVDILRLHPYELAHYNRLMPLSETKKTGWGEGLERAALWLNERDNPSSVSYYASVLGYWRGNAVHRLSHEYGSSKNTYVVLYRSMLGRERDSQETQYLHAYFSRGRCLYGVILNDIPYVWVFERIPEELSPSSADAISQEDDLLPFPSCESTTALAGLRKSR
jgi:4-amino-4-deoxy-L-arabinose transferase-like glycosyltransferase